MRPRIFACQRVFEQALNVVTKLVVIEVFQVQTTLSVLNWACFWGYPVVYHLLHAYILLSHSLLFLPILFLVVAELLHHFDTELFGARSRVHEFV